MGVFYLHKRTIDYTPIQIGNCKNSLLLKVKLHSRYTFHHIMLRNVGQFVPDGQRNVTLKADSHELRLTCTGMAEGCMQKIENFLSQLWQCNSLPQLHVANAACVNQH